MSDKPDITKNHMEKITKKYIIDFLNSLFFSNTVLWDGTDQFNELPIFGAYNDNEFREEQRGALLINIKTAKALRIAITALEGSQQQVCYRISGLSAPLKVDEGKKIYYPFDGHIVDLSIADLNLGHYDSTSYSFFDNTTPDGAISNQRLFTLLKHCIDSMFVTIDNPDIFNDLTGAVTSSPPVPSDPHYKLVFGVGDGNTHDNWD
jgi:hypothetical protein